MADPLVLGTSVERRESSNLSRGSMTIKDLSELQLRSLESVLKQCLEKYISHLSTDKMRWHISKDVEKEFYTWKKEHLPCTEDLEDFPVVQIINRVIQVSFLFYLKNLW